MTEKPNTRVVIILLLMVVLFGGCSNFEGDSSEPTNLFSEPNAYTPGTSMPAAAYDTAQPVDIFIQTGNGDTLERLRDGDYVKPGMQTLLIETSPRYVGGTPVPERVYVSNGGDLLVEAEWDASIGYYTCDFAFDDAPITYPLLVQVAYQDNVASKEKIVLTSRSHLRAGAGELITDGINIAVSKQLAQRLADEFNSFIGNIVNRKINAALGENDLASIDMTDLITLRKLTPASNAEGMQEGIFEMELVLSKVALQRLIERCYGKNAPFMGKLLDFFAERTGDIVVSSDLVFDDTDENGERKLFYRLEDIDIKLNAPILQWLLDLVPTDVLNIPIQPLVMQLMNTPSRSETTGSADPDTQENPLAEALSTLDLDTALFLNIDGRPEYTDTDFAVLSAGLYAAKNANIKLDPAMNMAWPEVTVNSDAPPLDIEKIRQTSFGIGLALQNINQIISEIIRNLDIRLKKEAIKDLLSYVPPETPMAETEIQVTLNPAGIALGVDTQMHGAPTLMLTLNDLQLEILENDIPMVLLSMDTLIELDIDFVRKDNGLFVEVTILALTEQSNFHVIKDNKGVALFDHSDLVSKILASLMGSEANEPISFSFDLSKMGLIPIENSVASGTVELAPEGHCYLTLDLESIDIRKLGF